jgi:glycosyltransferase involved in cell wall biosynthesis
MKINWMGYYIDYVSYGRVSSRLVRSLRRAGVQVAALAHEHLTWPQWMLEDVGGSFDNLTISAMEPMAVRPVPGRHWYLTMCEGNIIGQHNMRRIRKSQAERLFVPCEHNRQAFIESGWTGPIDLLPLGTDPTEFAPRPDPNPSRPYTFLAFADRGDRKGWIEVFDAFYVAFGGKTNGQRDVRLRIKCVTGASPTINLLSRHLTDGDPRVWYNPSHYNDVADLFSEVDCVVLPSHCEGWGMPHREAAMMEKPVITLPFSGLNDGHIEEWSIPVAGHMVAIPSREGGGLGEWMVADIDALAATMRRCYEQREWAESVGQRARRWLKANQTWDHTAQALARFLQADLQPAGQEELCLLNGR